MKYAMTSRTCQPSMIHEGGSRTQRQGAVRRLAWTASCCLAAESRGSRSNLVVVREARIERAQWGYPCKTGIVRLKTWWLEGRVEGVTFWSCPSQGDKPHFLVQDRCRGGIPDPASAVSTNAVWNCRSGPRGHCLDWGGSASWGRDGRCFLL